MAISNTRLYASAIALVSGVYSLTIGWSRMSDARMISQALGDLGLGGWIMLGIGLVVLIHGIALLTPLARSLARASGPLMVAWAVVMYLDQWLISIASSNSMRPMMEADPGMLAIATLMLVSGVIMIVRPMSTVGGDGPTRR